MNHNAGDFESVLRQRLRNPVRTGLTATGLYHSFVLPDGRRLAGAMPLEWQLERLASFGLPADLTGKRVLDIGPWDGFYTFEMERRGAEVVAVDYADYDTFRALHRLFGSRASYLRMDLYELDARTVGQFDIVLCLGVLYHLKHPLLALEKICALTRDFAAVDTFVVDGEQWLQGGRPPLPYCEFYERDELAGQFDNWCGPTVGNVESWIRAAGFARAEVRAVSDASARVLAHRHWGPLPPDDGTPLPLHGLKSHSDRGRSFRSATEEYIEIWAGWPHPAPPALDAVYPEVDGCGVAPLGAQLTPEGLQVNFRLPPGLAPGRHEARLKAGASAWSAPIAFYVDLPDIDCAPELLGIRDGLTNAENEVDWSRGGWMSLWVAGLSPEADARNTVVFVDDVPHSPDVVVPAGQINVRLRALICAGARQVSVLHRGRRSQSVTVRVTGTPPPIPGLAGLLESYRDHE